MIRRETLGRGLHLAAVAVLTAAALLALSTALGNLWTADLGRDGAAFALRGHLWLREGLLPYRDLWDHKPPGIYTADLLGELVTGDPRTGARAMESFTIILSLALTVALGRRTSSWEWGVCLAFWYLVTTTQPSLVQWGNFTELVLPPTTLVVALLLTRPAPRWAVIGLLCGGAILFRPTAAGLWPGALATLLAHETSRDARWRGLLRLTAGTVALPVLAALLMWARDVFPFFWDQVVTYNRIYAREAGAELVGYFTRGWAHQLWAIPGSHLVVALAAVLFLLPALPSWRVRPEGDLRLALFAAVSLATVWTGESLTGRFWPHQLIMVAPLLVLLLAGAGLRSPVTARSTGLLVTAAAALAVSPGLLAWWATGNVAHRTDAAHLAMTRFLRSVAEPGDRLQVWGAEDGLYLATGLAPASRYTYYYPLLTPGYATPELTRRFIRELEASRPRWVVTYVADTTLSPVRARAPAHRSFLAWLQNHGRPEVRFGNLVAWQLSWTAAPSPGRGGGEDRFPSSGVLRRPGPERPASPR